RKPPPHPVISSINQAGHQKPLLVKTTKPRWSSDHNFLISPLPNKSWESFEEISTATARILKAKLVHASAR
ncbi:MAG: hypothetical protein ACP5OK_09890, partial [Thermoprotei archaeon]